MAAEGLVLYNTPYPNKNSVKARIAAEYVGVELEVVVATMGETNRTPEYLALNPAGRVPTLKTPNGGVFESNAIARYVARLGGEKGLFGATLLDSALVDSWIEYSTTEIDIPLLAWVYPYGGITPYDKKKEQASQQSVKKALAVLEGYLQTRTFLVGDAMTLADIVMYAHLWLGFTMVFDPAFRKDFPNVQRYWQTLQAQPNFCKVFGSQPLPTEAPKLPAKGTNSSGSKAPKPAAPTAGEPSTVEPAPPAKKEDPMKLLPPTPMALDSWKRLYSNSPAAKFREVAIGGLWNGADIPNSPNQEHFVGYDPEGYSMWACNFKYNDENTVNFVVMNKVGGFLQRIDYVRKYAFGVMAILKDEKTGTFPITGVWIFRGPQIPQIMQDESTDLELYDWRKIDLKDEAEKKRVEDVFCEEATIDGLENVECKVFK